ncbi:hypothetical protein FDP41_007531 [Naegleria fowleri]|uniref:Uncharacterized protein n=1 Tax=Naegleria fowleri TaxID=5763 RepID=A0A6A5CCR2_NAEFO|nr:uncharacterized protein FDP41_007531 [Naegleria fowleri]KAF0984354.1 hypothetical protein FDP41_007531 [Naegleria fowleri]CAG4717074.1 unnamed protein product [Naegleria fowleri]
MNKDHQQTFLCRALCDDDNAESIEERVKIILYLFMEHHESSHIGNTDLDLYFNKLKENFMMKNRKIKKGFSTNFEINPSKPLCVSEPHEEFYCAKQVEISYHHGYILVCVYDYYYYQHDLIQVFDLYTRKFKQRILFEAETDGFIHFRIEENFDGKQNDAIVIVDSYPTNISKYSLKTLLKCKNTHDLRNNSI